MFSELGIYSFKTCARQYQESSGIQGDVGDQHDYSVEHMLHDGPETARV